MFKQHMTIGGSLGAWFAVIGLVTLGIGILVLTQVGALISVSSGEITAAVNEIQRWIVVALVLIFLLGGAFAYIFTRGITKPLGEAVKITELVASGDLRSEIEVKSRDETGQLLQALKNMNQNLGQIVRDVRHNAESMLTSVKEIAIGNLDLSQRTEEQASSLEETASSMEQLAAAMKGNVEDSKHINKLATGTSKVATNGAQIVESVVATMAAINMTARWTSTSGSFCTLSQSLAIAPELAINMAPPNTAMVTNIPSMARSRSRRACASVAPPLKRAVSRAMVGVSPMSSRPNHTCSMAKKPTKP